MTIYLAERLVTPHEVLTPGWARVDGDRITEVGSGTPAEPAERWDGWMLPGFVDMHVHGGGGASFTHGDPDQARVVAEFHRRHGTTTMLASLVTAPPAELTVALEQLAPLVADGTLAGVHLEGPFLAEARCGAHDPQLLLEPDGAVLDELLRAGRGTVRMVTVAPERPGGMDLIKRLTAADVVAAVGHSDADFAVASQAFDAGATVATHLFNGMPPLHHRKPGVVGAALNHSSAVVELINDGIHLHPAVVAGVFAQVGSSRVALVTDAMSAAGAGDGEYELGGRRVRVEDGVARIAATGSIAGSTLTMDAAVRNAVAAGVSIVDASRSASATPARAVGIVDVGQIAAGQRADLVVLDEELQVRAVARGGRWE
jgi:N-acetylglucosamine-6-phosphate deacetylase